MRQISVVEVKEMQDNSEAFVLLDVREPKELAVAAVRPCTEIPMQTIPARMSELDKSAHIVVMCHSGMRSMKVATYLESQGYDNISNIVGGINAWSLQIDPSVPTY